VLFINPESVERVYYKITDVVEGNRKLRYTHTIVLYLHISLKVFFQVIFYGKV